MREGKVLERHEHHLRDLGAGRERGHAVPAHEKDKRKLVVKAAVRADIALAEAAAGRDIGFVRVQSDLLACLAQRGDERRFAGVHVAGRGQVVEAGIERPVVLPFLQPDAAHAVTHAHDPQMADMVAQTLRVDDAARTRAAGAVGRVVDGQHFAAGLAVEQRLFLRAGQLFDLGLAVHGFALRVKHFAVRKLDRTAAARIFRTLSAVVRVQTGGKVVRPAAVQRPVRAAQDIDIGFFGGVGMISVKNRHDKSPFPFHKEKAADFCAPLLLLTVVLYFSWIPQRPCAFCTHGS